MLACSHNAYCVVRRRKSEEGLGMTATKYQLIAAVSKTLLLPPSHNYYLSIRRMTDRPTDDTCWMSSNTTDSVLAINQVNWLSGRILQDWLSRIRNPRQNDTKKINAALLAFISTQLYETTIRHDRVLEAFPGFWKGFIELSGSRYTPVWNENMRFWGRSSDKILRFRGMNSLLKSQETKGNHQKRVSQIKWNRLMSNYISKQCFTHREKYLINRHEKKWKERQLSFTIWSHLFQVCSIGM
jgi:hypothetical protein